MWTGKKAPTLLSLAALLVGCAPAAEPVIASELCARLAREACAVDQRCCGVTPRDAAVARPDAVSPSDSSADAAREAAATTDASATDASSPDASAMDSGVRDAGSSGAAGCESAQRAACTRTLGAMANDARLAYVATGGGALVAAMHAAGEECGAMPDWTQIATMFAGSGAARARCTPTNTSASALALSQASCTGGTTCRLYLDGAGAPDGVCEPRAAEDNGCSHPYDCPAGQYCNLASDWRPGLWGACKSQQINGWSCRSDLQCASHYCSPEGSCAHRSREDYCLSRSYAAVVRGDHPSVYLRLGDTTRGSAADSSGNGRDGRYEAMTARAPEGALAEGDDGALRLDGMAGYAALSDVSEFALDGPLTIEAWFRPENTAMKRPIIEFAAASGVGVNLWTDEDGTALTADFVGSDGVSHRVSTGPGRVTAGQWRHVALVFDGASGALYLNGVLVGRSAVSALRINGELRLGHRAMMGMGTTASTFVGEIDELAIYTRALAPERVALHIEAGSEGRTIIASPVYDWLQ